MRETRFHTFHHVSRESVKRLSGRRRITITSRTEWGSTNGSLPATDPVEGGGLAGSAVGWRIHEGTEIVLESLINPATRSIVVAFPALLSCVPLVHGVNNIIFVFAAFLTDSGCELVRLRCDFSDASDDSGVNIRKSQTVLTGDVITALHLASFEGEPVYCGMRSGFCAEIKESDNGEHELEIIRIDYPRQFSAGNSERSDSASMVSDSSRFSTASSISRSLISRIFGVGTPAAAFPSPFRSAAPTAYNEANSHPRQSLPMPWSRGTEKISSNHPDGDKVEAICDLPLNAPCIIALHASGRICGYVLHGEEHHFAGEGKLPVKFGKGNARQILLRVAPDRLVAVLTVDEDPQANSIRVFSISVQMQITRLVAISCRQIVKREGPIDRVVGAALIGTSVVIGTETGLVAGPLSTTDPEETGVGLPAKYLWTAVDDIDKPFGLGQCLDAIVKNPKERLLSAHRFSPSVIAKAMRANDLQDPSREEIETRVRAMSFEDDMESHCSRAIARAERLTIATEMRLHGLQFIHGIGVVTARSSGLFVFRKLTPEESETLRRPIDRISEINFSSYPVAVLAASQGSAQITCAKFLLLTKTDANYQKLRFMLAQTARFSESQRNTPITDRIARCNLLLSSMHAENSASSDSLLSFSQAVNQVYGTLEPGTKALRFLRNTNEMNCLKQTAEFAADLAPLSAIFASGVAWLAEYRTALHSVKQEPDEMAITDIAGTELDVSMMFEPGLDTNTMLQRAYGCLVSAAKLASSARELSDEDRRCVFDLASKPTVSSSCSREGSVRDLHGDFGSKEDFPRAGMEIDSFIENLGYWILERSVRLLEAGGSPKSAAAAALEAMDLAPDRHHYETMRAAAFRRFLDADEYEFALCALLRHPFDRNENSRCTEEEAIAFREAIGLFVNAVADRYQLNWLVERNLPEPLKSLAGSTLERRARANEPFNAREELRSLVVNPGNESIEGGRKMSDYEALYAWHLRGKNEAAAASCALEWAERLASEGINIIATANTGGFGLEACDVHLMLLLSWARAKVKAYSFSQAAIQLLDPKRQFFARSKFSVLAQGEASGVPGIVSIGWASRRQLLAFAQCRCLTNLTSSAQGGDKLREVNYLLSNGAPFLQENRQGVCWAIATLGSTASYENIVLCAELAAAWIEECGSEPLVNVVQTAGSAAASSGQADFDYSRFESLLGEVHMMSQANKVQRNWDLLGLESALRASAGASAIPQWLVDRAAWGCNYSESAKSDNNRPSGHFKGDVAGVVRAFLRSNRPIDAAKVLLSEFRRVQRKDVDASAAEKSYTLYQKACIPHAAVDATLQILRELEEDNDLAPTYRDRILRECSAYSKHIQQMLSKHSLDLVPSNSM